MKKFSNIKRNKTILKNSKYYFENKDQNIDIHEIEEKRTDVSKFFSKLFESREIAHIYHLQVNGEEGSYSKHKALGNYYEEIVEMIDDLIEVYQGQYGIVYGYDIIDKSTSNRKDSVDYFENLGSYIKSEKKCISEEDTHLHSLIDNISCLVYKTLYMLKFNR